MRVLTTPFTLNTPRRKLYLALAACSPLLWGTLAHAGPEGGRVVGGEGLIEQGNGITRIEQLSDLLAIDWNSFDVAADEIVSFLQPGSDSVALNRILGNSGSEILGQITANGQIFLVNPNGVVFGEGARLDVGGVLASGLDINPDDFMRGDFSFFELDGSAGQVINSGLIEAASGGSVTLLGRQVRNEGVISANLGAVNLAAGREAVLTFDDAGLMGVRLTREVLQEDLGLDAALINNGEISAAGGRVLLTASTSRDVFSGAVNRGDLEPASSVVVHEDGSFTLGGGSDLVNTGNISVSDAEQAGDIVLLGENIDQRGLIDADSGTGRGGDIELHAGHTVLLSGDSATSAQGATLGGDIKVLGHHVGLFDQAKTNTSGSLGGGRTFIGGDYQGDNPYLPNAWRTSVSGNAELRADALADGDGGRIIVWSDDITRFHGDIYGRGKGVGKGGFAEVSGKAQLAFSGYADLGGPGGGGTLLLDPKDIYVVPFQEADDDIPPIDFGDGGDGDINVDAESIENMLQDNSEQEVRLDARQDIFVEESIEAPGGQANSSLVFRAGNSININRELNIGASSVDFTAGVADCGGADCMGTVGGRNINIANSGAITTTGSVDFTAADSITVGASVTAGAINFMAGENITTNASLETTSGSLSLTAGDASLYTGDGDPAGNLTINSPLTTQGGDILLSAGGEEGVLTAEDNIFTNGGNLTVLAETMELNGLIETNHGDITLKASSGTSELGNQITTGNCDAGTTCSGNLMLAARNGGDSPGFDLVQSQGQGQGQQNGSLRIAGTTTLALNEGSATLVNVHNQFSGAVSIESAKDVAIRQNGDITIDQALLTGGLTVRAYGDVHFSGSDFPQADSFSVEGLGEGRRLSFTDTQNNWTIDTEGGGNVALAVDDGQTAPPSLTFTNFSALQGGTGNDAFSIGSAGWIDSLHGEGGTNSVGYTGDGANDWAMSSLAEGTLNEALSFFDIQELEGNGGSLTGPDANNTWELTGNTEGFLTIEEVEGDLTFSGMNTITGGSDKNVVNVREGATGFALLDGGEGVENEFNLIGDENNEGESAIVGLGPVEGADWVIQNFNDLSSDGITATLALAHGANTWTIDAKNAGRISHTAVGNDVSLLGGELTFSGFANLTGGDGHDAFRPGFGMACVGVSHAEQEALL